MTVPPKALLGVAALGAVVTVLLAGCSAGTAATPGEQPGASSAPSYGHVHGLGVDPLGDIGCARVFSDQLSGRDAARPQLQACLTYLRAGDTLVVPSLDRLSRSVRETVLGPMFDTPCSQHVCSTVRTPD